MSISIEIQDLLEALQTKGPKEVVQQYRHNLLPSRLLIDLYSNHPEPEVLKFLALYPTVPSQLLQSITDECTDPEVLSLAASNPRCSHNLLIKMAREGSAEVRMALGANKLHSQKVTSELINDPNLFVRAALAANPAISKPYQCALALDPEPSVRLALAATPKLEPELAHALSEDDSAVVRAHLYAYGKVDENILLGWALSDDLEAQRLLLTRNGVTNEMMESLCLSPYTVIQEIAQQHHEPLPHELLARAESDSEAIRIEVAKRELLPPEIQHLLASDPKMAVRVALAQNPEIDEEVALFIAASNDPETCMALARNPYVPQQVKVELCHHDDPAVRLQMAYRNDLSPDLLDILINQNSDLDVVAHLAFIGLKCTITGPDMLDRIIPSRRTSMRLFAAHSEQLEERHAAALIHDPKPEVRKALCENPTLSEVAFHQLAQDLDSTVADTAKQRIALHNLQARKQPQATGKPLLEEESKGLVSRIVRFFTE
jgi:hypothetical protein